MSRNKIIKAVQKRADTRGTKINAAESSRVARLVLDDLQPLVTNLVNAANALDYAVSRKRKNSSK